MTTRTTTSETAYPHAKVSDAFVNGIMRVSLGAVISFAGISGLWAMAALISAFAKAGGLIALGRAWFTAIGG